MQRVKLWFILLAAWLLAAPLASAQVIGQPTVLSAQSASVCATTNAFIATNIGNAASVSFGITGTWSGTLTFYGTTDGSTWVAIQVTNLASGTTPVTTATANGNFGLSNPGLLSVCVDFTTRSSGNPTVTVTRGWSARGGGAGSSGGTTVTGGTCANQVATAISTTGVPTCTTVTSAYKDASIASTGVDINTSYQVTATHLAAPETVAQGGTGLASGTSGGVLGYTAAGTLASSAALAVNAPVIGGGAGATPTAVTAGNAGQVFAGTGTAGAPAFVGGATLLKSNSGTTNSTTAVNLDTIALTGLTANDILRVDIFIAAAAQNSGNVSLVSSTDSNGTILSLKSPASGTSWMGTVTIATDQSGTSTYIAWSAAQNSAGANDGGGVTTFSASTAFTGSWTLALRAAGVTSGGTLRYRWTVYRIAGQ